MATALLAASFLLAWATYRFIEYPVRFGAHRHRRTQIVAASVAALGACGLAVWTKSGFPERFLPLPGIDVRKIGAAKLDADFKPTKGMEVLNHDWTLVAHLGHGERVVALSGDSLLFHYGPRVQQLADEGQLAANTYFVTGPRCPPVPEVIQQDKFASCGNLPGKLIDLVRREKVQSVVLGAAWSGYSAEGMLIEREGRRLPLKTKEGTDAFYANLEDYVRLLQGQGAKVYLVLHPSGRRLEPPPRCNHRRRDCVPLEGLSHQRPRTLEDDAASPARVHQAFPAARATQGFPPHPPLRALCLHQPRQEHRNGPCSPQCRPACHRSPKPAGCRAGYPACAAVPMPVLWRAHDRHRGVRARLPAELAADTEQDRHVMTKTSSERCEFPGPMHWLHAGGDLAQPNLLHPPTDRSLMRSEFPPKCLLHSPDLTCVQTCRWRRADIPPTIEIGANIKSP